MKSILKLTLILLIFGLVLAGCQNKENLTGPGKLMDTGTSLSNGIRDGVSYPIWAGQSINAGTVNIMNDADYIYVTYSTVDDWMLQETHVHIGSTLSDIPHTKKNIPIPGQFAYSNYHDPVVATFSYNIPRSAYTYEVGDTIIIAAHCSLTRYDETDSTYQQETGWGGNHNGPGPRWWYYIEYVITDDDDTPPDPNLQEETAMMRMYDDPADFTYNWGTHPWFSYVKTTPALTPQTFYFYAGQSYKCGEVQIWKEGDLLKVQANMMNTWMLYDSHLNVNLTGYSGPPAFGGFPWTATHDPAVNTYTYSAPWDTAWDNMELSIALHGVVKRPVVLTRNK
jgi:hypothetical protein